jgi:hypothetical protein
VLRVLLRLRVLMRLVAVVAVVVALVAAVVMPVAVVVVRVALVASLLAVRVALKRVLMIVCMRMVMLVVMVVVAVMLVDGGLALLIAAAAVDRFGSRAVLQAPLVERDSVTRRVDSKFLHIAERPAVAVCGGGAREERGCGERSEECERAARGVPTRSHVGPRGKRLRSSEREMGAVGCEVRPGVACARLE